MAAIQRGSFQDVSNAGDQNRQIPSPMDGQHNYQGGSGRKRASYQDSFREDLGQGHYRGGSFRGDHDDGQMHNTSRHAIDNNNEHFPAPSHRDYPSNYRASTGQLNVAPNQSYAGSERNFPDPSHPIHLNHTFSGGQNNYPDPTHQNLSGYPNQSITGSQMELPGNINASFSGHADQTFQRDQNIPGPQHPDQSFGESQINIANQTYSGNQTFISEQTGDQTFRDQQQHRLKQHHQNSRVRASFNGFPANSDWNVAQNRNSQASSKADRIGGIGRDSDFQNQYQFTGSQPVGHHPPIARPQQFTRQDRYGSRRSLQLGPADTHAYIGDSRQRHSYNQNTSSPPAQPEPHHQYQHQQEQHQQQQYQQQQQGFQKNSTAGSVRSTAGRPNYLLASDSDSQSKDSTGSAIAPDARLRGPQGVPDMADAKGMGSRQASIRSLSRGAADVDDGGGRASVRASGTIKSQGRGSRNRRSIGSNIYGLLAEGE